MEVPLHVGTEHPNLLWIAIPSLLSFAAGLGIGLVAGNSRTESQTEPTAEIEE